MRHPMTGKELYRRTRGIIDEAGGIANIVSNSFELDETGYAICFCLAHKILFDNATKGMPARDAAIEKYTDYVYDTLILEFNPEYSPAYAEKLLGACQAVIASIIVFWEGRNYTRLQERYNSLRAEFDEIKAKLRRQRHA